LFNIPISYNIPRLTLVMRGWQILLMHYKDIKMALLTEEKANIVSQYKRNEGDTGSPEVQIALLTENINKLQNHFKNHNKDHHSRTGLIRMVNLRRKLLVYLKRKNSESYNELVKKLNLRG